MNLSQGFIVLQILIFYIFKNVQLLEYFCFAYIKVRMIPDGRIWDIMGQNAWIGCFRGEQGESPRAKC